MTDTTASLTAERADLLESLTTHRNFLRFTVRGLTDEQATQRPTASELTLAGLIKHVASTESAWVRFIEGGPEAMSGDWSPEAWAREWRLEPGQTVASVLDDYAKVAAYTDALVVSLPDLDVSHPLPKAPWFRRTLAGRPAGSSCTSSPRPPSTQVTPTSCGRRSTARRRWGKDLSPPRRRRPPAPGPRGCAR